MYIVEINLCGSCLIGCQIVEAVAALLIYRLSSPISLSLANGGILVVCHGSLLLVISLCQHLLQLHKWLLQSGLFENGL